MDLGSLFSYEKVLVILTFFHTVKDVFVLYLQNNFHHEFVLQSMKNVFSIMFATIILASGMHFSIATHFCGGEIASKKISLSGSVASCGMEDSKLEDCSASDEYDSNCCKNTIQSYSIEQNYENFTFKSFEVAKNLLQYFNIPVLNVFNSIRPNSSIDYGDSPPCLLLASSVDLADICIFRI